MFKHHNCHDFVALRISTQKKRKEKKKKRKSSVLMSVIYIVHAIVMQFHSVKSQLAAMCTTLMQCWLNVSCFHTDVMTPVFEASSADVMRYRARENPFTFCVPSDFACNSNPIRAFRNPEQGTSFYIRSCFVLFFFFFFFSLLFFSFFLLQILTIFFWCIIFKKKENFLLKTLTLIFLMIFFFCGSGGGIQNRR